MNKKFINVYSWYGADKYVENSGLGAKDIKFSKERVFKIVKYFLEKGLNVMIMQTTDYLIISVSTRGFKQY